MKKIYLITALLISSIVANAQIINVGGPIGLNGKITDPVSFEQMPGFDLRQAQLEDSINDANKVGPWRFGHLYNTDISLKNAGTWTILPNGDKIWRVGISCPGALTINLIFSDFFMPKGAHVHVYAEDGSHMVGAYSEINHNPEFVLGTELVHSDRVVVEYYEPAAVVGQGRLKIGHVTHGYRALGKFASNLLDDLERGFGDSGACNYDANCTAFADPNGAGGWADPINSVAMIVSGGNGICTGALINNTCNNGTPYFLTADHCLGGANAPSTMTWAFRFNWQATVAGSACPGGNSQNPGNTYDQTQYGASLRANNSNSDFALLEITNMTLTDAQNYGAFYAGWDNTDALTVTEATGIHHPSGDIKKKCRYSAAPTHNTAAGAQVWWINDWTMGVTEPGSSGSPLFDQNRRIIGQLYGGAAACSGTNDNGQYDYYGRFGVSWDAIAGNTNSLEYWLDGDAGGCAVSNATIDDGWDPNQPTVADDAGIQAIVTPSGSYCGGSFVPEVVMRNYGTNTLTSVDIIYDIGGVGPQTYNWTGSLAPSTSTNVTLSTMTPTSGGNLTFNATTNLPNGNTDNNTGNDAASSSFTYVQNPVNVTVDIVLDNYGSETTWEIVDGGGITVASGGPYQDGMDQTLESSTVCLEDGGCYDFIIYDSYGDGICCAWGNGAYTVTEDATGNVLATGGTFTNDETTNFCLTPSSLTANFSANTTSVCVGGTVDFTDLSTGTPTTWSWSFTGGTPSTSTTQNPTGITYNTAGTYAVTLTVGDGTLTDDTTMTAYITVNPNPSVSVSGTNVTCYEAADGSATATTTGGQSPYTYAWSPLGGAAATASNLSPGTYTVDVTDANGCTAQGNVVITEPTQLVISNTTANDASCGASDGSIDVTATGGTPGYQYSTDGSTYQGSSTLSGLSAGNYTVYVMDANGCIDTASTTVSNPNAPTATTTPTDESCQGDCDGSAVATASGGTPGYTYAWNDPGSQTTATATGLCAGTYDVTVTDAAGCTSVQSVTVGSAGVPPTAAATPSATTVYIDQGATVVWTDNSTNASSWSWDFGDGNTSTSQNPSHSYTNAGTYTVTLTVTNGGCADTITYTIIVEETNSIHEQESIEWIVFPNPSNGDVFIMSQSNEEVQLLVHDAAGRLVYSQDKLNLTKGHSVKLPVTLADGVYSVQLLSEGTFSVKRIVVR